MNYDCDHGLFLALNFDGGPAMDQLMLIISGTLMWIPLYLLILWFVWRRSGWRGMLLFIVCMAAAIGIADLVSGIFKHVGVLKDLCPEVPPRLRPMYTPELEGLVHFPPEAHGGRYGTVSAHAATIAALAAVSIPIIRRRWFVWLMVVSSLLICYSRIYLAKHFPIDLLLGVAVGLAAGWLMWLLYRLLLPRIIRDGGVAR